MAKNDMKVMQVSDFAQAIALLSRLPLPFSGSDRGGRAAWAYPLVGLLLGGIAAVIGCIAHWLEVPAPLCALLSLAALTVLSGAMHEDGLADTADGLWGGWTREKRLEIMKDSYIGTYGVLALVFATAARWAALWLLFAIGPGVAATALIVSAVLSRAMMPPLMALLPHARADGLSRGVGATPPATAGIGLVIAVLIAFGLAGFAIFWPVIWAVSGAGLVAWIAQRKIGGQTGDILGACQQVTEIAILFSLLS